MANDPPLEPMVERDQNVRFKRDVWPEIPAPGGMAETKQGTATVRRA